MNNISRVSSIFLGWSILIESIFRRGPFNPAQFIPAQFNPAHWFKLAHVHFGALVQTGAVHSGALVQTGAVHFFNMKFSFL
jgi:hypothetical protein